MTLRDDAETERRGIAIRAARVIDDEMPDGLSLRTVQARFRTAFQVLSEAYTEFPDRSRETKRIWREQVRFVLDRRFPDVARTRRLKAMRKYEEQLQKRKGFASVFGSVANNQIFPHEGVGAVEAGFTTATQLVFHLFSDSTQRIDMSAAAVTIIEDEDEDTFALIASVFSIEPDSFQDTIVGRLQRLMAESKDLAKNISCDSTGSIIRAILLHRGWHSNRIWTGIKKISEKSGYGVSTVKRVMAFLYATMVFRKVEGEEKYAGPGSHNVPINKRKNDVKMESSCIDVSGLLPLLSGVYREAIEALLRGDLEPLRPVRAAPPLPDIDELFGDPFADTANVTDQTPVPVSLISVSDLEIPSDSFLETTSHAFDPEIGFDTPDRDDLSGQIKPTVPSETPFVCNVTPINKQEGKQENAPEGADRKKSFPGPEMGERKIRYAHTHVEGYKQANDALSGVGADYWLRRQVLEHWELGDAFTFAEFGAWRRIVGDANGDKIVNLGGYLTGTFREMLAKEKEEGRKYRIWDENFLIWRQRLTPVRSVAACPADRNAPPIRRPASKPEEPKLPEFNLAALTEEERTTLLTGALSELLAMNIFQIPKTRLKLIEEGWGNKFVQSKARKIWLENRAKRGNGNGT